MLDMLDMIDLLGILEIYFMCSICNLGNMFDIFFIWRETYINPREFPSSDKLRELRAKSSKFKASVKIQDNKFLINFLKFLQVIPYPLPVTH